MGILLTFGVGLGAPQATQAQNTYTVTSSGDADDANLADGTCETSGGDCTLRAAIQEANQTSKNDDIKFDLSTTAGFATIVPGDEYRIAEPVTIDGTTQSEYPSDVDGPVVILDGSDLSSSADDGIEVVASDVTIRGLAINSFPDEGIQAFSTADNVKIANCFVGIAADDGASDAGNGTDPDGSQDAAITVEGNDFFILDNVISHHDGDGIIINGGSSSTVDLVYENTIGLDHDGDAAAGNSGAGVRIVGGIDAIVGDGFSANYISANGGSGVVVEANGHTVGSNFIGTDGDGTTTTGTDANDLGNGEDGVEVLADDTEIDFNLISGNAGEGIKVGDGTEGPADNTTISDNNIGVNSSVDAALPNEGDGIDVIEGSGTAIEDNVVGGNGFEGIEISGVNSNTSARTVITGNYVGTNSNGASLGNRAGIRIEADPSLGTREVEVFGGNVVGNNAGDGSLGYGIYIKGNKHDVAGNYVGTNANGDDLGNEGNGIRVVAANSLNIGGGINDASDADAPNVIGNNSGDGIRITNGSDNDIEGNYVGTNADGDALGNAGNGIVVLANLGLSADNNVVGYSASQSVPSDPAPANDEAGNVIANSGAKGVVIEGNGAPVNNAVRGNAVYQNDGIGIDLADDGVTANDNANDDADSGPNNLQNFPVIEDISYNEANDEVSITYRVQTATGNAAYPLQIDFYAADSETSGEGQTYIGTQEYTSSDARRSVTNVIDLSQFSNVSKNDNFVATATDADGNTSEFLSTSEPLPVELASFEGTQTGESAVELAWTTASETNNAGFAVQRRTVETDEAGAADWEKVGYVESKADGGTTTETTTYRLTADDLKIGTHQFRLKQRDLDGSTRLHDPVTVELTMEEALQLGAPAPNPVQSRATLSFAVKEKAETTLTLYNTLGQRVRTVYQDTSPAGQAQTLQFDADGLASGVYFLRLLANGKTKTQRVTVVR